MAANPLTDQMLASLRDVLTKAPAGELEEILLSETIAAARAGLPDADPEILGETMMHLVSIFAALAERVSELDPTLTYRERTRTTLNVLAVAGARMHLGSTP